MPAVLTSLNKAFPAANISVMFQATLNLSCYFINRHFLAVTCKAKFRVIFGHFGKEILFLQGEVKLRKIWNVEDLIDGFGKLKFEVKNWQMNTKQSPTNLGLSFRGINCLVVVPTILILTITFNVTSNFTPIHVYPALRWLNSFWHLCLIQLFLKALILWSPKLAVSKLTTKTSDLYT